MSSNNEIFAALDVMDEALRSIINRPLHQLRPTDQRAVLLRLETLDKQLAAFQRRVLRGLVTAPVPAGFAGTPWAEVLARRLRISVGEAQRRIAEVESTDHPKTA